MLRTSDLPTFLYFGYIPGQDWPSPPGWLNRIAAESRQLSADISFDDALKESMKALDRCFDEAFAGWESDYIVPLSGGLDSRAILAGLLERVETSKVHTVTFGQPGQFDYEIGPRIAAAAGVRHRAFDLREVRFDTEALVRFGSSLRHPVRLFQAFLHHQMRIDAGAARVFCSGFFGDRPSGGHLPANAPQERWNAARDWFAGKNRYCRSIDPSPPGWRAVQMLPETPACEKSVLSFEDQLDMLIRQERFIRSIVMHDGYHYATPFTSDDWIQFWLRLPLGFRKQQKLYREALLQRYPTLFRLPTTNYLGLSTSPRRISWLGARLGRRLRGALHRLVPALQQAPLSGAQYLDFNAGLRRKGDLQQVVRQNLDDLDRRGAVDWLDLQELWRTHQKGEADHTDALTILAAAEIYLKISECSQPLRG